MFLLLLISVTLAVMIGPVRIHPVTVWDIAISQILGGSADGTTAQQTIVWEVRFPRALLGVIVGSGLAVVGTAMQALLKNSLADPYIIGVSAGASVGATLVILLGAFSLLGVYALSAAAFIGALSAVLTVLLLSHIRGHLSPVRVILAGVAISAIGSAITQLIVITAKNEAEIRNAMFWLFGSLAGAEWTSLSLPSLVVIAGIVYLYIRHRSLNAMLLGEETAETLGVATRWFRVEIIVASALLTGIIVAVSGPIGFVGLMVPHMVRPFTGSDHRRVLPVSALLGAMFVIWADVLARVAIAPEELPIGIITALCGGPFFIWLLRRSSYTFGGDDR
nr:iron ABC transporter permease [Paludifilum halophilum]